MLHLGRRVKLWLVCEAVVAGVVKLFVFY